VWAVGEDGVALRSTDGGATFVAGSAGCNGDLLAVSAVGKTVVAGGLAAGVWRSTDGGVTFSGPAGPGVDLVGVWRGDGNAWVVGDAGAIVDVAGDGVRASASGVSRRLAAMASSGAGDLYAVGGGGTILRSEDLGETWAVQPSGTSEDLAAVWASGAVVVAVGAHGAAVASQDHGQTFAALSTGTDFSLLSIAGATPTDLTLVGERGTILHAAGLDSPFTAETSPADRDLHSVCADRKGGLWAVGDGGTVLRSTDDGKSWHLVSTGRIDDLEGVTVTAAGAVVAVGQNGTVLITTDGSTFHDAAAPTSNTLLAVSAQGDAVLVVGDAGTILAGQ
jgi:photosystem II stability/assembly factor-like uncharacterized protein